ncbi:MAG: ATPase of the class [Fibrobacteres bacterium]|nr:ATPase of the class [Fibrobacterota bacterium]
MLKYGNFHWKGLLIAGSAILLAACGGGGNKRVYFGNLEDGSNVESPFKVEMKAENLIVEPATMGVNEGHGHFHIIVDAPLASPSEPMAKDTKHIHFGDGQTSTTLDLPVGQHTLILQFAKGDHVPYDPPIYQQVQINVTKQNVADTTAKAADSTAAKAPADTTKPAKADTSAAKKTDTTAMKAAAKPAKKAKAAKKAP